MTISRWHRVTGRTGEPPSYVAGPYEVKRVPLGGWTATGPGVVDGVRWGTKALAQDECRRAAELRLANPSPTAFVGDYVEVSGRRGRISGTLNEGKLFVIQFPRGRRLCLFRREFTVVAP